MLRSRPRTLDRGPAAAALLPLRAISRNGTKASAPAKARILHAARPSAGDPAAVASGTLRDDAAVAPKDMVMVYTPVIIEVFSAKFSRMKDGIATLHNAIPHMAATVPANSAQVVGRPRRASPEPRTHRASMMVPPSPSRLATHAVLMPAAAKTKVGMDGSNEATNGPYPRNC